MASVWLGRRTGRNAARPSVEEKCARTPGHGVKGRDGKTYVTLGPAVATERASKAEITGG